MAIYRNIFKTYRDEINTNISAEDVIDELIVRGAVKEGLYQQWRENINIKHHNFVDFVLQDDDFCPYLLDVVRDLPHLQDLAQKMQKDLDEVRNVVVAGGFPDLPLNYVERLSLTREVRESIQKLRPESDNVLVVHGMTGYGKSSLVNQVLQDIAFVRLSKGAMFWISLGQYEEPEHVLMPMRMLYLTAANFADQPLLPQWPESLGEFQSYLRLLFLNQKLRDALIILDDVKCMNIVKAFNISCRLVFTTQDIKLITEEKPKAKIISINKGFSENESRELWKKALNTNYLPEYQATRVHELCDGFPMLVNMIGSFLQASKEEALLNSYAMWNSIMDEVSGTKFPTFINDKIICVIKKNVERLPSQIQHYFHSLAVFPKHANIRPEILLKLWSDCNGSTNFNNTSKSTLNRVSLRQVMIELASKSLVVSFYQNDQRTYIYSIHSLIYLYLNEWIEEGNQEMIRGYHEKLVRIYDEIDNESDQLEFYDYILAYYGYHLKNANLSEKFSIYFDLKFIERKIRSVGCADVLRDFEIYKKEITQGKPELENKLIHYKEFVASYSSHVHSFPEISIVQYALYDNNKNTSVLEEGMRIAEENRDLLYFKTQPYSGQHKYDSTFRLLTDEVVSAICFTTTADDIILGMSSGSIISKSFNSHKDDYRKFDGHHAEIKLLSFSPCRKRFLSVSLDGTARLWRYVIDDDLLSPRTKQRGWQDVHKINEDSQYSLCYPIAGAAATSHKSSDVITTAAFSNGFCDERKILVIGTTRGKVEIWKGQVRLCGHPSSGQPITALRFSHDDQEVIVSSGSTIDVYSAKDLSYRYQLFHGKKIKFLLSNPDLSKQLISVDQKHLMFHQLTSSSSNHGDETTTVIKMGAQEESEEIFDNSITCVDIVGGAANAGTGGGDKKHSNGKCYVFVATNHLIYVYDLREKRLSTFKNDYGLLILAVTSSSDDRILFVGTDNDKVKRHELQRCQTEDKPTVRDVTLFNCYWRHKTPLYPIVTANNTLHIFKGNTVLSEIGPLQQEEKITCTAFSACGNSLVYGCLDGSIFRYHLKNKSIELLIKCQGQVKQIKCYSSRFNDGGGSLVSSYLSNCDVQDLPSSIVACDLDNFLYFTEDSRPWSQVAIPCTILDVYRVFTKIFVVDSTGSVLSISRLTVHYIHRKLPQQGSNKTLVADKSVLSKLGNLLALVTHDKGDLDQYFLDILRLDCDREVLMVPPRRVQLKCPARCMSFTLDGRLLAVGMENGDILVFNTEANTNATLRLHQHPVECVLFSHGSEPILVSLSHQVAWWNLNRFAAQSPVDSGGAMVGGSTPQRQSPELQHLNPWHYKKVRQQVPYLLSSTSLREKHLRYISASNDFKSFLIVDEDGNIYKLDAVM